MILTLTLASVRFVHMAISSRVLMSGYRFLAKVASNSCSCWLVKCVRCLRCLLFFLPSFSSLVSAVSTLSVLIVLRLGVPVVLWSDDRILPLPTKNRKQKQFFFWSVYLILIKFTNNKRGTVNCLIWNAAFSVTCLRIRNNYILQHINILQCNH